MSNTIKAGLAGLSVTAALAAGIGLAGPAQATNYQDIEFLNLLDSYGINANTNGIPWGHGVCTDLANGYSLYDEVRSVYYNTDRTMTWDNSASFVAVSVIVYCPWENPAGARTPGQAV